MRGKETLATHLDVSLTSLLLHPIYKVNLRQCYKINIKREHILHMAIKIIKKVRGNQNNHWLSNWLPPC